MPKPKVRLEHQLDQIQAQDSSWLNLGDLRELVRQADAHAWNDSCLLSHSVGGSDHPTLRGMRTATYIVVEGPA